MKTNKYLTVKPKLYKWTSKPWEQIQESVINTNKHFIDCILNNKNSDTSGQDNIKSLSMVFAAYESNKHKKEILLK
jgi:predicted dehydrogenase